jgi:hypothetical protein
MHTKTVTRSDLLDDFHNDSLVVLCLFFFNDTYPFFSILFVGRILALAQNVESIWSSGLSLFFAGIAVVVAAATTTASDISSSSSSNTNVNSSRSSPQALPLMALLQMSTFCEEGFLAGGRSLVRLAFLVGALSLAATQQVLLRILPLLPLPFFFQ